MFVLLNKDQLYNMFVLLDKTTVILHVCTHVCKTRQISVILYVSSTTRATVILNVYID